MGVYPHSPLFLDGTVVKHKDNFLFSQHLFVNLQRYLPVINPGDFKYLFTVQKLTDLDFYLGVQLFYLDVWIIFWLELKIRSLSP